MQLYKFRILLDSEDNVLRDIELFPDHSFLDLHNALIDSVNFSGKEMASFYLSNDKWDKGHEIPLFDMSDSENPAMNPMSEVKLSDLVSQINQKILYVYDFLRMWIFYVELIEIKESNDSEQYPLVAMAVGDAPEETSKEMNFTMETELDEDAADSGFEEDEDMGFDSLDDYEEFL